MLFTKVLIILHFLSRQVLYFIHTCSVRLSGEIYNRTKLTATPKQWIIGILASIVQFGCGIRVRYRLLVTYHVALYSGVIVYVVVQKNNQSDLHNLTIFSSVLSLF